MFDKQCYVVFLMSNEVLKDGKILSGKALSKIIRAQIKEEVAKLKEQFNEDITLATILVGENPASKLYVSMKHKACHKAGINSINHHLPEDTSEKELLELIDKLNKDPSVNGILVQLPLPDHINERNVINAMDPKKDVDGFHPYNVYETFYKRGRLEAATPKGVIRMLDYMKEDLVGKDVTLINRSIIVGKPLALMLINRSATVTVCHSKTRDLAEKARRADILITAIGRRKSKEDPYFITEDMVKEGAVVIDVASPYGDVDLENVLHKVKWITPVPGGVGPMTVTMLLENVVIAYKIQKGLM